MTVQTGARRLNISEDKLREQLARHGWATKRVGADWQWEMVGVDEAMRRLKEPEPRARRRQTEEEEQAYIALPLPVEKHEPEPQGAAPTDDVLLPYTVDGALRLEVQRMQADLDEALAMVEQAATKIERVEADNAKIRSMYAETKQQYDALSDEHRTLLREQKKLDTEYQHLHTEYTALQQAHAQATELLDRIAKRLEQEHLESLLTQHGIKDRAQALKSSNAWLKELLG